MASYCTSQINIDRFFCYNYRKTECSRRPNLQTFLGCRWAYIVSWWWCSRFEDPRLCERKNKYHISVSKKSPLFSPKKRDVRPGRGDKIIFSLFRNNESPCQNSPFFQKNEPEIPYLFLCYYARLVRTYIVVGLQNISIFWLVFEKATFSNQRQITC